MKDNKNIAEAKESTVSKEYESKADSSIPAYDPDDYMTDYYIYNEPSYCNENCFACKYWLGYACIAPNNPCNYDSF